jgi:hypothetical protein
MLMVSPVKKTVCFVGKQEQCTSLFGFFTKRTCIAARNSSRSKHGVFERAKKD